MSILNLNRYFDLTKKEEEEEKEKKEEGRKEKEEILELLCQIYEW